MLLTLSRPEAIATRATDTASAFVVLGFVEVAFGLAGAIAADFAPVFYMLALLMGGLGALGVILCILLPRCVKVYDLTGATLLMAYGTGTLISMMSYFGAHQELLQVSLSSPYWLTRSLGLAAAVSGMLHLLARVLPGGGLFRPQDLDGAPAEGLRLLWFVGPVMLVFAALLAAGKIGFMGQVSAGEGADAEEVSPIAMTVASLATPTGALALYEALKRGQRFRYLLLIAAALLLLMQFGLGRRVFLFSLMTYAMGAISLWKKPKFVTFRNMIILVACLLMLNVATTAFYALRMATWTMGKSATTRMSVLQLIPRAYQIYKNDRNGEMEANIRKNVKSRTFVLEYLAQISEGEAAHGPLYGEDLHRALVVVTPSALYKEKHSDKLMLEEEALINPRLGLPIWDAANSLYVTGIADLGLAGMCIYPVLLGVLFAAALAIVRRAPPVVIAFTAFAASQILFTSEADISGYLSAFRGMLIITAFAWIFFSLVPAARPIEQ